MLPLSDIIFLITVIAVFSTFGGVLAFAAWDETRRQRNG